VHQVADPETLYNSPVNQFVAGFIGSPQMNFIEARLTESNGAVVVDFEGGTVGLNEDKVNQLKENNYTEKDITLGIRPEHIEVEHANEESENVATVEVTELLGSETYLFLDIGGKNVIARVDPALNIRVHDKVKFNFTPEKVHLFDRGTEEALLVGAAHK